MKFCTELPSKSPFFDPYLKNGGFEVELSKQWVPFLLLLATIFACRTLFWTPVEPHIQLRVKNYSSSSEEESDSEVDPNSRAAQMAAALGDDEYCGRDSGCTCVLALYQVRPLFYKR